MLITFNIMLNYVEHLLKFLTARTLSYGAKTTFNVCLISPVLNTLQYEW